MTSHGSQLFTIIYIYDKKTGKVSVTMPATCYAIVRLQ